MIGTSDGQTFEGEWDYIQSRFGPMHTNPPAEEGHASFTLADVLEHPTVQSALANPKIDRTHDVPYESGASKDPEDTTTHIDKRIPSEITLSGVKIDPAIPANIHEQVEREAMERLIKSGMPQDKAYEVAHHQYAEVAEDNWYRAHGINIKDANDWWFKQDKITEHENPENPPPNLYTKPYPHNKVEGSPSTAAQYMTHEAEGPNPVAPFVNMVKRRAMANLQEFGSRLMSPEFQTVLGTVGPGPGIRPNFMLPEARQLARELRSVASLEPHEEDWLRQYTDTLHQSIDETLSRPPSAITERLAQVAERLRGSLRGQLTPEPPPPVSMEQEPFVEPEQHPDENPILRNLREAIERNMREPPASPYELPPEPNTSRWPREPTSETGYTYSEVPIKGENADYVLSHRGGYIHRTYTLKDSGGNPAANIPATYSDYNKTLKIDVFDKNWGLSREHYNTIGGKVMRSIVKQLKKDYPEARFLTGFRVGGARAGKAATGGAANALIRLRPD